MSLIAEFDIFKRVSNLTEAEENNFKNTTFDVALDVIRELQTEQEKNESLMYMMRLEQFLVSMQQFGEIVGELGVFSGIHFMAYIWVGLAPSIFL